MADYQGNSKKDKLQKQKPQVQKVVTGEVVVKPKSLGTKIKGVFFGGEAKEASGYLVSEVLLPAFRNLVVDSVRIGVERMVYGDRTPRRPGPTINDYGRYSGRTTYTNPLVRPDVIDVRERGRVPDQRQPSRRKDTNNIFLARREDAEEVLERLQDIINDYDVVSVADLHDMIGLPTTHIDNKWGWTFLNDVEIRQTRDGFVIELPSPDAL